MSKTCVSAVLIAASAALLGIRLLSWKESTGQAPPPTLSPNSGAGDTITLVQGKDEAPCECEETRNRWLIGCLMMQGEEPIFRCGSKYALKDLGMLLKQIDSHPIGVELTVWPTVPQAAVEQVRTFFEEKGLSVHVRKKEGS